MHYPLIARESGALRFPENSSDGMIGLWHSGLEHRFRFCDLIRGPVKLDTVLPTARHRCDVSSEVCG